MIDIKVGEFIRNRKGSGSIMVSGKCDECGGAFLLKEGQWFYDGASWYCRKCEGEILDEEERTKEMETAEEIPGLSADILLGNRHEDGSWTCEHCKCTRHVSEPMNHCTYADCNCGERICGTCTELMANMLHKPNYRECSTCNAKLTFSNLKFHLSQRCKEEHEEEKQQEKPNPKPFSDIFKIMMVCDSCGVESKECNGWLLIKNTTKALCPECVKAIEADEVSCETCCEPITVNEIWRHINGACKGKPPEYRGFERCIEEKCAHCKESILEHGEEMNYCEFCGEAICSGCYHPQPGDNYCKEQAELKAYEKKTEDLIDNPTICGHCDQPVLPGALGIECTLCDKLLCNSCIEQGKEGSVHKKCMGYTNSKTLSETLKFPCTVCKANIKRPTHLCIDCNEYVCDIHWNDETKQCSGCVQKEIK